MEWISHSKDLRKQGLRSLLGDLLLVQCWSTGLTNPVPNLRHVDLCASLVATNARRMLHVMTNPNGTGSSVEVRRQVNKSQLPLLWLT